MKLLPKYINYPANVHDEFRCILATCSSFYRSVSILINYIVFPFLYRFHFLFWRVRELA